MPSRLPQNRKNPNHRLAHAAFPVPSVMSRGTYMQLGASEGSLPVARTMPQYNSEEEAGALPEVPERLLARHVAIQTLS